MSCYYKDWYKVNGKAVNARRTKWHREHYVPHPKVKKTPEELKETRKKYYEEHREYYREKNRQFYLAHKDDEEYKERQKRNTIAYIKKRRAVDEEFAKKCREYVRKYRAKKKEKQKEE